jgi:hypothetical protein
MEAVMPTSVNQWVLGIAVAVGLAVVGVSAIGNAAVVSSSSEQGHGTEPALSTSDMPVSANDIAGREQLRMVFLDTFNARIR